MSGEIRYISRKGWGRILDASSTYLKLDLPGFKAVASLMKINKVKQPLVVKAVDHDLTIVDDGYMWMQLAPEGQHWWMSVMFDRNDRIIQYYFDTTKENFPDGDRSCFIDLFLDVVALPDGQVDLLDQDELDAALEEGVISTKEYWLSVETANMLLESIPRNIDRLNRFCYELAEKLK